MEKPKLGEEWSRWFEGCVDGADGADEEQARHDGRTAEKQSMGLEKVVAFLISTRSRLLWAHLPLAIQ